MTVVALKRSELGAVFARANPAPRGLLLHGPDRAVVRELGAQMARRRAAARDGPFAVSRLSGADIELEPGRLGDDLCALAMTGDARLVRVRLATEKPAVERAIADTVAAHARGEFNPDAFLLLESDTLDKTSPLRKAAESAAAFLSVVIYADEDADVARLVRETLARDRLSLEPAAMETFVARMPHARGVVRAELERLALFLGPGRAGAVGSAELEQFLGVEPEANLFDAATHAFGGRLREAHQGWRRALAEGEDGPAAVRAMSAHASRLRRARSLMAAGKSVQDAARACRVFWKEEREFVRQLASWRAEELDRIQPELHEADKACKSTGSPTALLAERLLVSIALRARRLRL